jgi:hypothetical protein
MIYRASEPSKDYSRTLENATLAGSLADLCLNNKHAVQVQDFSFDQGRAWA